MCRAVAIKSSKNKKAEPEIIIFTTCKLTFDYMILEFFGTIYLPNVQQLDLLDCALANALNPDDFPERFQYYKRNHICSVLRN